PCHAPGPRGYGVGTIRRWGRSRSTASRAPAPARPRRSMGFAPAPEPVRESGEGTGRGRLVCIPDRLRGRHETLLGKATDVPLSLENRLTIESGFIRFEMGTRVPM